MAHLHNSQAVAVQKVKLAIDMFRDSQDRTNLARAQCLLATVSGVSPMGVVQLQDGLDTYKQTQDRIGEAEALQQMAELESALSNPAASCKNWIECLEVKRSIGHVKGTKTCLASMLIEYEKLNDAKRMLEYGAQLNELARQSDDVDKASHALLFIGKAHTRLKSPEMGIEALTAAVQLCETAPNSSKAVARSAECHDYLAQCYLLAVSVAGWGSKCSWVGRQEWRGGAQPGRHVSRQSLPCTFAKPAARPVVTCTCTRRECRVAGAASARLAKETPEKRQPPI
jgi:hypothetical protein